MQQKSIEQAATPAQVPRMTGLPSAARHALLLALATTGTLLLHETLDLTVPQTLLLVAVAAALGMLVAQFLASRQQRLAALCNAAPALLTSTLDALTEGILLLDTSEHIIIANQAFSGIAGIDPAALQDMPVSALNWKSATSPDHAPPWRLSLRDGRPRTGRRMYCTGAAGSCRHFMVRCTPLRDLPGLPGCVLVSFSETTQRAARSARPTAIPGAQRKSRDASRRQYRALQTPAGLDPLTGCLSRRRFLEQHENVFRSAQRDGRRLACIMADIDMFKQIIDRHGQARGNEAISKVAESLRLSLRSGDAICRYGREEFCILLPGVELSQAQALAERARSSIRQLSIKGDTDASAISITASFGVSSNEHETHTLAQLIDRADKALFRSKSSGRNRVSAWTPQPDTAATILQGDFIPGVSISAASPEHPAVAPVLQLPTDPVNQPGHDSLTGLPNRKQFYSHLAEALQACRETRRHVAVMMLDIDMFKRINGVLGYAAGDQLLQLISSRLEDTLRCSDSIAQLDSGLRIPSIYSLGGDEFGILLTGLDSTLSATRVISRIIDAVTEKFDLPGNEIFLTCSIGASIYPDNGTDADTLLKHACSALYYAKLQGHNSYQFYDASLGREQAGDRGIATDLARAIRQHELELYYQPTIDLGSGHVNALEALVRWKHPDIGMIPPHEFLPVAEEAGLMPQLGYLVIETACRHLSQWQAAGHANMTVSVNLSAAQFHHQELLKTVLATLAANGLQAGQLTLEITESTIMGNLDAATSSIRGLHDAGILISVDDFGTGYSSLNLLKRLPIRSVKIDRSFIRNLAGDADAAAIVSAIISTARKMGLKVIAEGVETAEQLALLRTMHCDAMQGFLFSPPLPHNEALELLGQPLDAWLAPEPQTLSMR